MVRAESSYFTPSHAGLFGKRVIPDNTAAHAVMPPRSAFEAAEPTEPEITQEATTGVEASTVWHELSPERQEEARKCSEAMARMPIFESRGVKPEDFRVVKTGEADDPRYSVAYAKTERLNLGDPTKTYDAKRSWNSIKPGKPNAAFMTEVDGQSVDVRSAQTYDTLAAVSKENPAINELVWRTGEVERAGGLRAPAVDLFDGQADGRQINRDSDRGGLGFRPAVALK